MNAQPILSEQVTVTTLEGQPDTVDGTIEYVDASGILRIALRRPLPEGSMVRVESDGKYSTTGRVLHSLPHGDSHYVTIGIQGHERRREKRIAVAEAVQVVSVQPHGAVNCQGRIADVSKCGIGLITPVRIPCGVLLKVVLDGAIVFGEVRHCSAIPLHPESFKVGISIETVIFRNGTSSGLRLDLKALWAALTVGCQSLAGRIRRDGTS